MGRKRKEITKDEQAKMGVESAALALQEHGLASDDPDFKDVQIYVMHKCLGFSRAGAARALGFDQSKGTRVYDKLRHTPEFRHKCEGVLAGIRAGYQDVVAARLPDIVALDTMTLQQYKDNPDLLISKPQALKHLRQVANVQAPDGVVINPQGISIQHLESLQFLFQGALTPDNNDPVVDAEIVKDSK